MIHNYKWFLDIRQGTVKNFIEYLELATKLTYSQKEQLFRDDEKFSICQLTMAFFEMLNFLVPNEEIPLREYVSRDEMKIFLVISLIESTMKLKNKNWGSKKSVKRFFCDYFLSQDKNEIEDKIVIEKDDSLKERKISFCEFVDILYKIRCNFTHEGEYICQFFYHNEKTKDKNKKFHEYENIGSDRKFKDIKTLKINISFIEFEQMIKNAIKNYLNL